VIPSIEEEDVLIQWFVVGKIFVTIVGENAEASRPI
jgi:hypothetical protein